MYKLNLIKTEIYESNTFIIENIDKSFLWGTVV